MFFFDLYIYDIKKCVFRPKSAEKCRFVQNLLIGEED